MSNRDNSDKPFPCTIGSCKQRFTNADHLQVHCLKHEMSLKSLDTPIINDTTPTPTRFLKNESAAEDALFTDLVPPTNPFDVEFKKASEKRRMSQDALSSVKTTSLLDTPDPKTVDSDSGLDSEPILETVEEDNQAGVGLPVVTSTTAEHQVTEVLESPLESTFTSHGHQTVDIPVTESVPTEITTIIEPEKYEPPMPLKIATTMQQSQPQLQPQPQPPEISQQRDTKLAYLVSTAPPTSSPTQTITPLQTQANSLQSIVNSLPSNITTPLLIKLPDGQQIRVVPSIVANPSAHVPVATSANQSGSKKSSKPAVEPTITGTGGKSAVKEILKSTLLSNQSHGNMNVMARAVEVVSKREEQEKILRPDNSVTVVAPGEEKVEPGSIHPGTKRRSSDEEDPEVKRQKFLERNRAAAMRCREKKKQWVNNLESKAENLTVTNVKLNNEVLKLKNEVAQLKQLLLAHKDCPVTQMQQRQSQNWQVFHAINESEEEKSSLQAVNSNAATNTSTSQISTTNNHDKVNNLTVIAPT